MCPELFRRSSPSRLEIGDRELTGKGKKKVHVSESESDEKLSRAGNWGRQCGNAASASCPGDWLQRYTFGARWNGVLFTVLLIWIHHHLKGSIHWRAVSSFTVKVPLWTLLCSASSDDPGSRYIYIYLSRVLDTIGPGLGYF